MWKMNNPILAKENTTESQIPACQVETGYRMQFDKVHGKTGRDKKKYRKDELFKRLKVATFAQLVIQVASVSDHDDENDKDVHSLDDNISVMSETDAELLSERTNGTPETTPVQFIDNNNEVGDTGISPRSTLQSVISGVGEMDLDKTAQKNVHQKPSSPMMTDKPYPDCPYLLLDVRDRDDYDRCHVIGAYSYPIATLSRTMNPYTKEVLEYKNASGKIIILYDEDERIASQAATTMCERGFENLFMLSGGLKVIAQKFPEGMTTGSFPAQCLQSGPPTSGRKRSAPRQPSYPAEDKWRFTAEDLNKMQFYLEEMLIPADTNSRLSRLSSGSSSAKTFCSSARSRQTPSVAGSGSARSQSSRPWK
ncbi:centrosomal protein of 41 kDa isoform X2 [Lepisosteus oculatus]|uniref:centrosomal protein of 41 kDa isoform X2 n=2 Tax=Lepisosteus oculatus TaxID=7918 RepID=UPI00370FD531